jgi:hypothetical protein
MRGNKPDIASLCHFDVFPVDPADLSPVAGDRENRGRASISGDVVMVIEQIAVDFNADEIVADVLGHDAGLVLQAVER